MSQWPSGLPQAAFLGASVGDDESRLISPMDTGPASVRKRFTAFTQTYNVPIILTGSQLLIFQEFYRTTLNQGTDSFTWIHPVDDSTVTMRFKSPPQWQSLKSGASGSREWQATLNLEILP